MGFIASKAVEPLDYDFTPYVDVKGRIPEPSNQKVKAFLDRLQELGLAAQRMQRKVSGGDGDDSDVDLSDEEAVAAILSASDAFYAESQAAMAEAVNDLTDGNPTGEQFSELPFRLQGAFMAWLGSELRPEAAAAGTKG